MYIGDMGYYSPGKELLPSFLFVTAQNLMGSDTPIVILGTVYYVPDLDICMR